MSFQLPFVIPAHYSCHSREGGNLGLYYTSCPSPNAGDGALVFEKDEGVRGLKQYCNVLLDSRLHGNDNWGTLPFCI